MSEKPYPGPSPYSNPPAHGYAPAAQSGVSAFRPPMARPLGNPGALAALRSPFALSVRVAAQAPAVAAAPVNNALPFVASSGYPAPPQVNANIPPYAPPGAVPYAAQPSAPPAQAVSQPPYVHPHPAQGYGAPQVGPLGQPLPAPPAMLAPIGLQGPTGTPVPGAPTPPPAIVAPPASSRRSPPRTW
jgi:hypothetical protein